MQPRVVTGDLLDQDVDAIVNAWNRNVIPWWLLVPQGVSGAIKRRAGRAPFRELARHGAMALGSAVVTGAGKLPHRAIIHVAGIDMTWRTSESAIRACVRSAVAAARDRGFRTIAIPLIGAGTGGFGEPRCLKLIQDELSAIEGDSPLVTIVRFGPHSASA